MSRPNRAVNGPAPGVALQRQSGSGIFRRVAEYRAWAEIDLDALTHNLAIVRQCAGPGTRVMLVVKADAYGHGATAVAHHAVRCGIGALGVGNSAEALDLRESGVRLPILILGTVIDDELGPCLRNDVHVGLHSGDRTRSLERLCAQMEVVGKVHLNVDTGMGRLGVLPARALELLSEVQRAPHLELAGVMTHVSAPDGALDPQTARQLARFDQVLDGARAGGLLCGWIHAANSAAIFTGLGRRYDTVRPGIAAYGALPAHLPGAGELRPVLALRSQVVFLKDVPRGTPVGYGSTWRAPRATRIATIPMGYDDGIPWHLVGPAEVLVRGRRAPLVGRVSMDYTTVDVGHVPDVRVGDVVTVIGRDGRGGRGEIRLEDWARLAQTIPYEIACSIGKRVRRVFAGGEQLELPAQVPRAPSPEPSPAGRPPRVRRG